MYVYVQKFLFFEVNIETYPRRNIETWKINFRYRF